MARYLYSELSSAIGARLNCIAVRDGFKDGNESQAEWADKHEERIERLVKDFMPSGSGFDNGTRIDFERSHAGKLVFETAFHHMDENGYYDGWTEHTVTVTPSFQGFDIRVTGRNRNDIKEVINEDFHYALMRDCEYECLAEYFEFPAMHRRWENQNRMYVVVDALGTFDSFESAKAAIVKAHKESPFARKA